MGLSLSVHAVHSLALHPPFSRVFDRCPVLVGRDEQAANCVLPDDRTSRLHASFDVRDGCLVVRDSGSTNGTYVGGQRLPSNRWVAVGGVHAPCEIHIGGWVLKVTAGETSSAQARDESDFLTIVPGDAAIPQERPKRLEPNKNATELMDTPTLHVFRAWRGLLEARNELVTTLTSVLDAAPFAQRAAIVQQILKACEGLEREPGVRELLTHKAGVQAPHTLETGAVFALRELARWYVNDRPPLSTASEGFAFARKLKAGIDELLLGLVPLFAGLDRFEHQMALRPHDRPKADNAPASLRLPRVPRHAARALFDWHDPTDRAVRAVRTDLVDLAMHQVAVLNGVMRGVKQLLSELSPETIEAALRKRTEKRGVFGRLFSSFRAKDERWELFRERHGDLADEENERFRVIFGPEFVAEYKQSGHATSHASQFTQLAKLSQPVPTPAGGGSAVGRPPPPTHPKL